VSIEEQIRQIVSEITHSDKKLITKDSEFKDFKADSLDIMQTIVAVEDKFGIQIDEESPQDFRTFGEFVSYVERLVKQKETI